MFTALTFNMQNAEPWEGPGNEPQPDIHRTLAFLKEHDADLIFLQEVERGYDGGRQVHPPPNFDALRTGLPEYHAAFAYPAANPDELPFGLGLAIFSRTPLESIQSENLPAPGCRIDFGGRERRPSQRGLLGARTHMAGADITVFNTHLQAFFMIGASSDDHPQQRDRIEEVLRSAPPRTLLAGDFNCAPGEGLIGQFHSVGFRPVQTLRPTWKRRPYALDHIFFNNGLRLVSCEVIPTNASDHHAVQATFQTDSLSSTQGSS
jgi:endonuclease/exonuclease/phosphatase family metal-dependent hydrolase